MRCWWRNIAVLARQFDIGELVVAGNHSDAVIVIMSFVPMIMPAGLMDFRGEDAGGSLYRFFRADSAHMAGAAVRAFHLAQSGESRRQIVQ